MADLTHAQYDALERATGRSLAAADRDHLDAHIKEHIAAGRYPGAQACSKPCPPDRIIDAMQMAVAQAQQD